MYNVVLIWYYIIYIIIICVYRKTRNQSLNKGFRHTNCDSVQDFCKRTSRLWYIIIIIILYTHDFLWFTLLVIYVYSVWYAQHGVVVTCIATLCLLQRHNNIYKIIMLINYVSIFVLEQICGDEKKTVLSIASRCFE